MERKKKTVRLWSVVLYGVCAVMWIAYCVFDYIYNRPLGLLVGLRAVCAITWCAAFSAQIFRYRKGRKNTE